MNQRELAYIVGDFDPIDEDDLATYELFIFLHDTHQQLKVGQTIGKREAMQKLFTICALRWPDVLLEHDDCQIWPENHLYLLGLIAREGSLPKR